MQDNTGTSSLNNSTLENLLNSYQEEKNHPDLYKNILSELMAGDSFLLLSSEKGDRQINEWSTTNAESEIQLTCVQNVDGLKVLAAFTSEELLLNWTKQPTHYTIFASKDLLKLCQQNQVDRIVINDGMFVLEKNRNYIQS